MTFTQIMAIWTPGMTLQDHIKWDPWNDIIWNVAKKERKIYVSFLPSPITNFEASATSCFTSLSKLEKSWESGQFLAVSSSFIAYKDYSRFTNYMQWLSVGFSIKFLYTLSWLGAWSCFAVLARHIIVKTRCGCDTWLWRYPRVVSVIFTYSYSDYFDHNYFWWHLCVWLGLTWSWGIRKVSQNDQVKHEMV